MGQVCNLGSPHLKEAAALRLFARFCAVLAAAFVFADAPALAKPQPILTAGAVASPDRYGALAAERDPEGRRQRRRRGRGHRLRPRRHLSRGR
jgi:hypothetical protein